MTHFATKIDNQWQLATVLRQRKCFMDKSQVDASTCTIVHNYQQANTLDFGCMANKRRARQLLYFVLRNFESEIKVEHHSVHKYLCAGIMLHIIHVTFDIRLLPSIRAIVVFPFESFLIIFRLSLDNFDFFLFLFSIRFTLCYLLNASQFDLTIN